VLIGAIVDISFCLQIVEIDSHIACAFSGLTADSKTLIDRARVECQNHWFTYDEKMQVGYRTYLIGNFCTVSLPYILVILLIPSSEAFVFLRIPNVVELSKNI
jgi:20S proteasome alpha/beta subunit